MRLKDALSLMGSIPERDFAELIDLACSLAELRTEIECAQAQVEEAIQRRIKAEHRKTETEAAMGLLKLRTGIGS